MTSRRGSLSIGTKGGSGGGGGPVTMGGDCALASNNCKVVGLQGTPILDQQPNVGQILGCTLGPGNILRWGPVSPPTVTEAQLRTAATQLTAPLVVPVAAAPTGAGHLVRYEDVAPLARQVVRGVSTISIAGSSATPRQLTAVESEPAAILITGARTADWSVALDTSQPGRAWAVTNGTTGGWLGKILGTIGSCYLAPGQTKVLWLDDDRRLRGEDLALWRCEIDWPLTVGASGDVDVTLVRTPPRLRLSPVLITSVTQHVGGGEQTLIVGTSAGGSQIIKATAPPDSTSLQGRLASELGTDADDGGSYWYATAQTLYGRHHRLAAVTGAGVASVELIGRVLR